MMLKMVMNGLELAGGDGDLTRTNHSLIERQSHQISSSGWVGQALELEIIKLIVSPLHSYLSTQNIWHCFFSSEA